MHRPLLLLALFAAAPLGAQQPAAPAPAPAFKQLVDRLELQDGNSFVFLGDSITHQCLYTQYVEDFIYTRFPERRIHFHNAGVGGDRAKDALTRFDEDVAAYKPKYVSVLLGMNDGSYRDFDKAIFDTYQKDMATVLEKIDGIGAIALPMTPTMFDTRAKRLKNDQAEPRNTYYNGVLSLYGSWLREQAEVRGLGFVDMWSPLNNLTMAQRRKDANFTMIADGVHPGPDGQAVMAVAMVNDLFSPAPPVSQIQIEKAEGKLAATSPAGDVADFKENNGTLEFTFRAKALPWMLPKEAARGVQLTELGRHFSSEKLTARDMPEGNYELKIDGASCGVFTRGQLASGVELGQNPQTPQSQQALKVATLNQQRNTQAYGPLRGQYAALKGKRRDLEKAEQAGDAELPAKKAAFDEWYAAMGTQVAALLAKAKEFEEQIYAANQPQPRRYELVPTKQ